MTCFINTHRDFSYLNKKFTILFCKDCYHCMCRVCCVCVSVSVLHSCIGAHRSQKRAPEPLELEQ